MDVCRRITLCRIVEEMNENKEYSRRLGIRNQSIFSQDNEEEMDCEEEEKC